MEKGSFIFMMHQMVFELIFFLFKCPLRIPANTASEQAEVIGTIEPTLESLKLDTQKRKKVKV